MKKRYSFEEKNEQTKQRTEDVVRYLNELDVTAEVQNVEKIKRFQKKDIDLIWTRYVSGGSTESKTIEVKVDFIMDGSGNLAFETVSNTTKGTLGCFLITQADRVFYVGAESGQVHIIKPSTMVDFFFNNREHYESQFQVTSTHKKGKHLYDTEFYKIPVRDLVKNGVIEKTINVNKKEVV